MELIAGKCIACKEKRNVLTTEDSAKFIEYIKSAFFTNNNEALREFEKTSTSSLCPLCAQRSKIAYMLRNVYETERTQSNSPKSCFVCGIKFVDLVLIDPSTNNLEEKFTVFMNCSPHARDFLKCYVCLDCLFGVNIWFDFYTVLSKTIKSMVNNTMTEWNNCKQDLDSSSEDNYSRKHKSSKKINLSLIKSNSDKTINVENEDTKRLSKSFLNKTLKQSHFKREWFKQIARDKKMVSQVPYVLISENCNIHNKTHTLRKKAQENKLNLDVSTNSTNNEPRKSKRTIKLSKKLLEQNNSNNLINLKKTILKSKTKNDVKSERLKRMSNSKISNEDMNKQKRIKQLFQPAGKSNNVPSNSGRVSSTTRLKRTRYNKNSKYGEKKIKSNSCTDEEDNPETIELSDDEEKVQKHICHICDRTFSTLYEYKADKLWHEKPERVIVNLIRCNFAVKPKAPELLNKNEEKPKISLADVSNLVQKYVGETDVFEEELNTSSITNEPPHEDPPLSQCDDIINGLDEETQEESNKEEDIINGLDEETHEESNKEEDKLNETQATSEQQDTNQPEEKINDQNEDDKGVETNSKQVSDFVCFEDVPKVADFEVDHYAEINDGTDLQTEVVVEETINIELTNEEVVQNTNDQELNEVINNIPTNPTSIEEELAKLHGEPTYVDNKTTDQSSEEATDDHEKNDNGKHNHDLHHPQTTQQSSEEAAYDDEINGDGKHGDISEQKEIDANELEENSDDTTSTLFGNRTVSGFGNRNEIQIKKRRARSLSADNAYPNKYVFD